MSFILNPYRHAAAGGGFDKTDLIAFWKLTEVSGTRYDAHAVNNFDLTDNNTVTQSTGETVPPYSTAGDFTRSFSEFLNFDDGDTIDTENAAAENEFTVTAWAKLDTSPTVASILSTYDGGSIGTGFFLIYRNDISDFRVYVANDVAGKNAATTVTVTTGTWYFVSTRYSESSGYLEISADGGAWSQTPISAGAHLAGVLGISIGSIRANSPANTWDGQIQAVSYWKRALTDQEVIDLSDPSNSFYTSF